MNYIMIWFVSVLLDVLGSKYVAGSIGKVIFIVIQVKGLSFY